MLYCLSNNIFGNTIQNYRVSYQPPPIYPSTHQPEILPVPRIHGFTSAHHRNKNVQNGKNAKKDCCILPSSVFIVAYIDAAIVLGDYKLLILCFVLNLNLQESNLVKERVDLAICIEKVAWLLDKGPLVGNI